MAEPIDRAHAGGPEEGLDTASDTASDTAADTAAGSGAPCGRVEGGGCAGSRGYIPVVDACLEEDTDSGAEGDEAGDLVGGGLLGCAVGAGALEVALSLDVAGIPVLASVVVLLLRRAPWRLLVSLAALIGAAPVHAQDPGGVNAWTTRTWDGGDFPVLTEADLGAPWRPAVAVSFAYASQQVYYVQLFQEDLWLSDVLTREIGLSFNIGGVASVGVSFPRHMWVVYQGVSEQPLRGDRSLWVNLALFERDRGESVVRGSWTTRLDLPTGAPELFLGDPGGGFAGVFALEGTRGRITRLGNIGVRLQTSQLLPGMIWGTRITYGAGFRAAIWGPTHGSVEVLGSAPLTGNSSIGNFPAEAVLTGGVALSERLNLNAGAGLGLTRGLGAPTWRGLVMLDARLRTTRDTDSDGVMDSRDDCVFEPEDFDRHEDRDGCPEPDNDGDGFVDPVDDCPDAAEVWNGWRDGDGCPDEAGALTVSATSETPGALERVRVTLSRVADAPGGAVELERGEERSLLPGEPLRETLGIGRWQVEARAPGHAVARADVDMRDGDELTAPLVLTPLTWGRLRLTVLTPSGQPVEARIRYTQDDGAVVTGEVAPDGEALRLPAGELSLVVLAQGFRPEPVQVDVVAERTLERTVTLQPVQSLLDDLGGEVRFERDRALLLPETLEVLDEVAALLALQPAIELIRIEGHADEEGSSRYNYALSQRRAEAVLDYLIQAGVAPERLQAVGTGEARSRAEDAASRRVSLVVLIWDEVSAAGLPGTSGSSPSGAESQ